ncbi:HAMP domain-containing sensor histidine kinase [Adlercreutzia murintestinalis]|uniref:HAMP domain-containing sensor histidine kinase n=1 Tax=Adlercreutzia murintestinalis TaxID=2941325 RepID=UPI00204006C8|nr:HAMP domain-containing sensor histidine kinase [Adlercreutzia murintestinalis]
MKKGSLKKEFARAVAVTMLAVSLASGLAIFGCYQLQKSILPDSDEVWLTQKTTAPDGSVSESTQRIELGGQPEPLGHLVPEGSEDAPGQTASYAVDRIESSFSMLTAREKAAYRASQAAMVGLPLLFALLGIALAGQWFYRKKLEPPIRALADATAHVKRQDLDFQVHCESTDELGQLCTAFEDMRQALVDNNRLLWDMLEQRRALQASVAHDLRNPIAIVGGYVEYLQEGRKAGLLTDEELDRALGNLRAAAERMGRYTEVVREVGAIEDLEVRPKEERLREFLEDLGDSLAALCRDGSVRLTHRVSVPECTAVFDGELLYRVLENLVGNALRYARSTITLEFHQEGELLAATVTDDGPGFPKAVLRRKDALLLSEDASDGHLGLGLATSRVFCRKLGGSLELSNSDGGARAKVLIAIEDLRRGSADG